MEHVPVLRFSSAEPSLMGMPNAPEHWTAERVRALPDDGFRHEVVDGVLLMTPAPSWRHQAVIGAFYVRLRAWLKETRLGHVVFAPADVELDAHTLVEPDLFVVPLVQGRKPSAWEETRTLLLVIEVLSPSSTRADRHIKLRRYQRFGVPEYWIVDPDTCVVERWTRDAALPEILADCISWQPQAAGPELVIDLGEVLEEVGG